MQQDKLTWKEFEERIDEIFDKITQLIQDTNGR